MKTTNRFGFLVVVAGVLASFIVTPVFAENELCLGGIYHKARSSFTDYPFADGDLSYGVAY